MDMDHQLIQIEGLTRVVNFIDKKRGDESENLRLLSSFQQQFPYHIKEIYPIREHVFKINTTKGAYILKGYSSYSRLKLQETFTASLQKEGFHKTYSFLQLDQEPIFHQNKYFGCLPYIEPHHRSFTFETEKERVDGLNLLNEFHLVTINSVKRYQTILAEFNLLKKWTERFDEFVNNTNTVSKYIPMEVISDWMNWAEWSLEGINQHKDSLTIDPPVILHGDVAHHNFLRKKDGKLLLIDFDLITIGSKNMDLLQYANRILPFINWNFNHLYQYKSFKSMLSNPVYMYALVYPTDLFREWNRVIREGVEQNSFRLQMVLNQSLLMMNVRKQFHTELIKLVTPKKWS
jgi:thiamine kinase-like enzyme